MLAKFKVLSRVYGYGMSVSARQDLQKAPIPLASLAGVIASVTVFALAQGLSYPLLALLMQKKGMSASEIGFSAAMSPLGMIATALLVPVLIRRLGAGRVAVACALLAALLFWAIGMMQNWLAWYPMRFLLGAVVNPLYVLAEVWMIALAPTAQRGRFVGVFNLVTGVGYAAGPLTLVLVGSEGWAPLAVGILSFVACAMLLAATTGRLVGLNDGSPSKGVLHFWKVVPVLLIAVIVSAAVQQSTYSLLLVFGTSYGLAEATLVALIIALSLGNIVLQLPLGLMAERFSAKAMIEICAIISLAGALLMPILVTTPAIWLLMLMMGGVGFGLYTMALVELGNNFSGSTLVAGNAAFGLMWGVGCRTSTTLSARDNHLGRFSGR
jgi:MFS family permease